MSSEIPTESRVRRGDVSIETVFSSLDPPKSPESVSATLKAGWEAPMVKCPVCDEHMEPEAYCDLDGWGVTLVCADECSDPVPITWPFVEDLASSSDFMAAGFIVP